MTARVRLGLDYAVVFVAYVATARFGLSFDALAGIATTVWPPTGIALAALILRGPQLWPAVALAALRRQRHDRHPALGRRDHRDGKHAGGGGGREPAAALLVRPAAGAPARRAAAGRAGGARQHADQRDLRRGRRRAGGPASRRELPGVLGGVVGGRRDGRPADRAADLRVGAADPPVAAPAALAGGAAAGGGADARQHDGVSPAVRHPRDRVDSRHVRDRAAADLGGVALRAARDHGGAAAGRGDRRDRDVVAGQLFRRAHAPRAPADDRLLHGGHGDQHADAGRRAGRAARGDRRPRRVHLDRVARAQDAAHRAQAAVDGGDPDAAAAPRRATRRPRRSWRARWPPPGRRPIVSSASSTICSTSRG